MKHEASELLLGLPILVILNPDNSRKRRIFHLLDWDGFYQEKRQCDSPCQNTFTYHSQPNEFLTILRKQGRSGFWFWCWAGPYCQEADAFYRAGYAATAAHLVGGHPTFPTETKRGCKTLGIRQMSSPICVSVPRLCGTIYHWELDDVLIWGKVVFESNTRIWINTILKIKHLVKFVHKPSCGGV